MKYVQFDGMNWPSLEGLEDMEWNLRYARLELTQMEAVALVSAYRNLVRASQKRRNYVCREVEKRSKFAQLERSKEPGG